MDIVLFVRKKFIDPLIYVCNPSLLLQNQPWKWFFFYTFKTYMIWLRMKQLLQMAHACCSFPSKSEKEPVHSFLLRKVQRSFKRIWSTPLHPPQIASDVSFFCLFFIHVKCYIPFKQIHEDLTINYNCLLPHSLSQVKILVEPSLTVFNWN